MFNDEWIRQRMEPPLPSIWFMLDIHRNQLDTAPSVYDGDSDEVNSILSSVNFSGMESDDRDTVAQCLCQIQLLLECSYNVCQLPAHVVRCAVEHAQRGDVPEQDVMAVTDIISHYGRIEDEQCQNFVTIEMVRFLVSVIESNYENVHPTAICALAYITDQKSKTIQKLIDEGFDVQILVEIGLSEAPKWTTPSLILLSHCFVFMDLCDEANQDIIRALYNFHDEFPLDVLRIMNFISYWKAKSFIEYDEGGVFDLLISDLSQDSQDISKEVFSIAENLSFHDVSLAYAFLFSSFLDFEVPLQWADDTFLEYARSMSTMIHHFTKERDEGITARILEHINFLMEQFATRWEDTSCKVKEVIVNVICNMLVLGDDVTEAVMACDTEVFDYICEMMLSGQYNSVRWCLGAMERLSEFGLPLEDDPFLAAAEEYELSDVLEAVATNYEDEEEIQSIVHKLMERLNST